MIRVTIELLSAVTGRTSTIGTMFIANDGNRSSQDPKLGDYIVAVCRRGSEQTPREFFAKDDPSAWRQPKATRTGTVKEYPRLAYNVWRLITRALLSAFPEEMPTKKLPKGTAPVLDEQVMRGLVLLREHYDEDGHNWLNNPTWHEDIEAARTWLDANSGLQVGEQ